MWTAAGRDSIMSLFKISCGLVVTLMLSHFSYSAPVTSVSGEDPRKGPKPGTEWGADSDGARIYHSGEKDSSGRSRVFKFDSHTQRVLFGHVEGQKIVWLDAFADQKAANPAMESNGRRTYYPASKYPEVKSDKGALPRERSLVVVKGENGERQNHSPRGTGQAELTNKYPERLVQAKNWRQMGAEGLDERYRPSRLARAGAATESTRRWMKTEIDKLVKGRPNALSGEAVVGTSALPEALKKGAPRTGPMIEMGQGVGAFYVALGIMAGVQLYADYANNPAAWEAYLHSATDPSTIAQVVAFMGVAGGSYYAGQKLTTKIFGEAAAGKPMVRSALYGGSLLTAVFATTVLSEMMADPNTGKCIGITAYKETGVWTRDIAACDAFWETWQSNARWNKLATDQILPMFANIMVAGGMLKAFDMGLGYLLSRQFVATGLERIAFGFTVKGGPWVTFGSYVMRMALFFGAYQVSDQIFGVGQKTREFFAADWSFSNDPLGNSISAVETNLYREWNRLKTSDFAPNDVPAGQSAPNNLSYDTLINKYSSSLENWRQLQMNDVQAALQQWSTKVFNYYAMLEVASDFYKAAAERIAFDQTHTDPAERAKNGFNREFLDAYVKSMDESKSPSWKAVKDMNFAGTWKHVATFNAMDYLVTSMACGPEAEGYIDTRSKAWATVSDFWSNWVSGNTNPKDVVKDSTGWAMRFQPPRIVRPLDGAQSSVCQAGGSYLMPGSGIGVSPKSFMVSTDTGEYRDLMSYISAETRPSVIDAGKNQLDVWWRRAIGTRTIEVEAQLRKDYEELLNTKFHHALTNNEYYACVPSNVALPDLEQALRSFGLADDVCPMDATHRLSRGILNSLRDEMRLYMGLLADMHESNRDRIGPAEESMNGGPNDTLRDNSIYMLSLFDQVLKGANAVNPADRPDIAAIKKEFAEYSTSQKMSLLAPSPVIPSVVPELQSELKSLQAQMQPLLAELTKAYDAEGERSARVKDLRQQIEVMGKEVDAKNESLNQINRIVSPYAYLETWAYELGNRIDGTFNKAIQLYSILTTFEKAP